MDLSINVRRNTARMLLLFCTLTAAAMAEERHVVPMSELRSRAASASEERRRNVEKLERFLAVEPVRQALRSVKLDETQVRRAVAVLSSEELARLAARAEKIQVDLSAGALNNQELTYIVIALATAVVILVIVAA